MSHALIVEDDTDFAETLRALIARMKFTAAIAHTIKDARQQLLVRPPDVVLLDIELPDGNGMELFADDALMANCETVLITGHATLDTSIQALRLGAADYLIKPINLTQLQGTLSRVTRPSAMREELNSIESEWQTSGRFGRLLGRSAAMRRIFNEIARVAQTSVSVFITGESGTGKEMAAQTIHELSRRRKQPFFGINCGALSPTLIESQLFGHERGSFTGAEKQHTGFFERCNGGTLFLDEITEMPLDLQVKLLRVLETGTFMRVGSSNLMETDVRIIAATNRSPQLAVSEGRLREDLFYRLNVFPLTMPSLRDHPEDVPLLAESFLVAIAAREGARKVFSDDAFTHLAGYGWPGNVRELRNLVHRAYVMTEGTRIDRRWLAPLARSAPVASPPPSVPAVPEAVPAWDAPPVAVNAPQEPSITVPIGMSMSEIERRVIFATMEHYGQHKERVAAVLGISLKTLYNRLKEYANSPSVDQDDMVGS
ncbi:MAG TPA: sigma-54 dependent transcriptional regulator [Burkholderiaceae bacterium]|nr:sigma-54 dependent transcriptional regulator [Burkholderiaceae bacterium]